ncbi:hypothetical protein BH23ACT6_BH23ACT6_11000 [soil metagenome]
MNEWFAGTDANIHSGWAVARYPPNAGAVTVRPRS